MLEEQKMDKKYLNRSSQPQSKASALDSKRNTESTHKPWTRSNKKREGTGNIPKNEPYRKNLPAQRGRGQLDRRPRPRGGPNSSMGGTENTGLDDDEPELGSVFSPGSKKQNLNHLLNFMYPTRGGPERRDYRPRRFLHNVPHKYEHDLYLRAYCQFVMKEGGDYKMNTLDPDVALKWEQIEEIVVRSSGRSECPICLGSPAAARVGVCGHVYCWACVLHYTNTHEKQPPPCPVCTAPLHVKDMKPARMLQWRSCTEEVTMRLVRRLRGSTIVEVAPPRGERTDSDATPVLPLEKLQTSPYCKLFSASKQQIREILHRERKEIQNQILEEVDTSEIVYLEQALEMLKSKEEQIDVKFDEHNVVDEPQVKGPIVYEKLEMNDKKFDWFDVSDEGAASLDCLQNQLESLEVGNSIQSTFISEAPLNPEAPDFNVNGNQPEEFPLVERFPMKDIVNLNEIDKENQAKYFYFYQAEDGEQVFLNSLNLRILNASWGALPAAPQLIRGRVLHRETLSLSEQTRKHMPHTAHLPLYCSFDIVELDLQPPYVTTDAINSFSAELDRRARMRARNEREERRRERAYRRAMEGPPKPDFSSDLIFPPAPSCPVAIEPVAPSSEMQPSSSGASPSGVSFAKMASTSGTWRVRKTAAPSPPPAVEDQEGTGPRTLSLSDAIEAALHAPTPPSSGKKKKTKHKVLFATGMQRAD